MAVRADRVDHDALDDQVRIRAHGHRRIGIVRGKQAGPFPVEDLAGHLPIDDRHDDAHVFRLHGPIHDQEVAVEDAHVFHRRARDAAIEGRGGVLDEVLVQVELPVHVVVRGAGEPGRHGAGEVGNPVGCPGVQMLSQIFQFHRFKPSRANKPINIEQEISRPSAVYAKWAA